MLLLDEPYQGFDWETYLRFWDLAAGLRARGKAVVIITHLVFEQDRFDQRLVFAGYRQSTLIAAKTSAIAIVAAAVASYTAAVLRAFWRPGLAGWQTSGLGRIRAERPWFYAAR